MSGFKIGDEVIFGRQQGEQTLGTITGVTRGGRYKVRQDEPRGRYPVGSTWTVDDSIMRLKGEAAAVQPPTRPSAAQSGFAPGDRAAFHDKRKGRIEGTVSQINRTTVSLVNTTDGHPVGWRVDPNLLTKIGTGALPERPALPPYRQGDLVRFETLFGLNRTDMGGCGYNVGTVTWVGHEPGRGGVVEINGWRRAAESTILGKHDVQRRPFLEVFQDIRSAYTSLSPENLSCDGERRGRALAQAEAGLRRWLRCLFIEAGRHVSEAEAYATEEAELNA